MKTYTVIGIYADNHQRWASTFEASDADEAEELALAEAEGELVIAGVVEGAVTVVA